jgi:hypothetical protein
LGLIIDVLIAYLIKLILRLCRGWGSNSWKLVKAKIDSSSAEGGWVWNCPTAEIAYTYDFDGHTYSGSDAKPFLSDTLAKEYVDRFKAGETVVVRVNPARPERSVLRQADQTNSR